MTSNVFLDPEKISKLEPSEGDERNKAMLSPSAVPRAVSIESSGLQSISKILFQYSGGEMAGGQEPLDERNDPSVTVRTSTLTHKILELSFAPPLGGDRLPEIAGRLERRAESIPGMGKRLSYRMIARLLVEKLIDVVRTSPQERS